ncbi:DUF4351 domain-containing protein [Okeania sp. KiyG1]|uniref:DUF4351 domain-containing protein n=1 Tax=Okeania sp. KiyG1 TaxID=2720165 RepID=UPI0019219EC4|nr:DUF4351 domain-containing protein [Okeania sp. KiyG1]GGA41704.1 hypothetical protein CYANOKiyG1_60190 [Okeania sp. KiyG1]
MLFKRGFKQGQIAVIITLITHRFGDISETTKAQIRRRDISQLNELAIAQLNFTSLDDLTNWLSEHAIVNIG